MAVPDLDNLLALLDDAKCFALVRPAPLARWRPLSGLRQQHGDPGRLRRDAAEPTALSV